MDPEGFLKSNGWNSQSHGGFGVDDFPFEKLCCYFRLPCKLALCNGTHIFTSGKYIDSICRLHFRQSSVKIRVYPIGSMYGIFNKDQPNVGIIYHTWILWVLHYFHVNFEWAEKTSRSFPLRP